MSSLIKEFNKNIFMRKIKSKESGTQADNRNSDKIDNHQFYRYFFIFFKDFTTYVSYFPYIYGHQSNDYFSYKRLL